MLFSPTSKLAVKVLALIKSRLTGGEKKGLQGYSGILSSMSQLHCASAGVSRQSKCFRTDKSLFVSNSPSAASFGPSPSLPLAPCVAAAWFGSTVSSTVLPLCRPLAGETPLC